jgi:hypothetical protein
VYGSLFKNIIYLDQKKSEIVAMITGLLTFWPLAGFIFFAGYWRNVEYHRFCEVLLSDFVNGKYNLYWWTVSVVSAAFFVFFKSKEIKNPDMGPVMVIPYR